MASLQHEAIKGMSWTAFDRFATQIIRFVIGVIIARLLLPSDYGIIGMLAIFMAISQTLLESGFGSALIQKKDRTDIDYSTVFYFNIGIGLLMYLILFIAAPWIADFYHIPLLTSVTRVYMLTLFINSINIVQNAKLKIELRFKTLSIISVSTQVFTGIIGIIMAYNGWGVWALVYQGVFSSIFQTCLVWWQAHWVPKKEFSKKSFNQLFSYGGKLLVSSMINNIYSNLYTLVIGRKFSSSDVGYFNRANQFATLPSGTLTSVLLSVNFPILSKIQDDDERLVRAYSKLLLGPMFLLYPILFGLIALSAPFIVMLIGPQWLPCVPFLRIACVGAMFAPLTSINLNLLYVKGRTDLVLKLEFIKKPIGFALLLITMNFGIIWLIAGAALYEFIAFSINCYYTGKILNYGWGKQLKELLPIFVRSCLMGIIIYFVSEVLDAVWLKLLLGFIVGVCSYCLMAWVMKDQAMQMCLELIRQKNGKKK